MVGRVIALAGTSSVGKSSVAARLQEILPEPHLVVGIDHFFSMFPQHWEDHPRGPGPGFWYEESTDPDGSPRSRIRYGAAGERLLAGMRASVRAMLDCGNNVILDEMPVDTSIIPAWKRELAAYPAFWVHLAAPLSVVEQREAWRTRGRQWGNARGHFGIADGEHFDLVLDASSAAPGDLGAEIKRASSAVAPHR